MDANVKQEYDRLKALPREGYFTFLHHQKILERSSNLMDRVEYLLREKPESEHYLRLRHIYPVAKNINDDYQAKLKLLYDDYWAKLKLLDDNYQAKLKPLDDDYLAKRQSLDDDYWAKRKSMDDDYLAKRKPLYDDYRAKCKPLNDEIIRFIPDCTWNGETIFGQGESP